MTKDEKAWLDAIVQLGCIVDILTVGVYDTPAEPHHLLSGGRRMGHMYTIPLSYDHHRSGRKDAMVVSRHPWHREFEARYGTELYLLSETRKLVLARNLYRIPQPAEEKLKFCTKCRTDQPAATFVKVNRYREICDECAKVRNVHLRVELRALPKRGIRKE